MARPLIGQLLKHRCLIDDVQLISALAYQQRWGGRLGDVLLALGFVREDQLLAALGVQLSAPVISIGNATIAPDVVRLLPEKFIRRRLVFPLNVTRRPRRRLLFATTVPADLTAIDEVAFAAGMPAIPLLASRADISRAIARHLGVRAS